MSSTPFAEKKKDMPLSGLVSFFFHVKSSVFLKLFFQGFYFRKINVAFQVVTHTLLFGHFGLSSCLLNTHTRNIKTEITTTKQVVYTHKHVLKKKKKKKKATTTVAAASFQPLPWQLTAGGWKLPAAPAPSCGAPAPWSAACLLPRARRSAAWSCPSPAGTTKHSRRSADEHDHQSSSSCCNFAHWPPDDSTATPVWWGPGKRTWTWLSLSLCGVCASDRHKHPSIHFQTRFFLSLGSRV